jgi:hypothetical protein
MNMTIVISCNGYYFFRCHKSLLFLISIVFFVPLPLPLQILDWR